MGDVDDEVAHLLEFLDNVYVEHACLLCVVILLDVDGVLLTQAVAVLVDVVLGILGVGDVLEEQSRRASATPPRR